MIYKILYTFGLIAVVSLSAFTQSRNPEAQSNSLAKEKLNYPPAKKVSKVVTYHNEEFSDDYGWLENANDSEVQKWVKSQDNFTTAYTRSSPFYEAIKKRLTDLSDVKGNMALPEYSKDYLFYVNDDREGKWNLYKKAINDTEAEVLPLPFDARAAQFFLPNPQGTHVALGLAMPDGYFDWKIYDVQKKALLPETLRGSVIGNTRLAWAEDGNSFYYIASEQAQAPQNPRTNLSIKKHTVGTKADGDNLIYKAETDGSKLEIDLADKKIVVVERDRASTKGMVFYFETENEKKEQPVYLEKTPTASYVFLGNRDSVLYFETDRDAPRGKIVSIDTKKENTQWKDVVKQNAETIMGYQSAGGSLLPILVKDKILVVYQKDLKLNVKIYDFAGLLKDTVELPSGGLYFNANGLNALSGKQYKNEALLRFIGITEPNTILKVDAHNGKLSVFHRATVSFNSDDYESKIVFAESKDGTKVPISLTYKKGLKLDGKNYLMMQVYGAIAFVNYPYFQGDYIGWLEMGGIHAVAHIRGGGAYGEKWHQDGIKRNKQNGIDDYIAALKWVTEKGYTSAKRIVMNGTSAGTIPVVGVLTQQPELVGGAVLHYGMLDMLSYASKYRNSASYGYMIPEIGDATILEDFRTIRNYSPYQKIDRNTSYPPTLALTSDQDFPLNAESFKWVAKMQDLEKTSSPQLLQIAWGSTHSGFGSKTHSTVTTFSDELAFLVKSMNIKLSADLKIMKDDS
ncbi:MAG: prolyl oligopeptidase family serine peptidase [Pyrinomonadaceae bacterium]